MLKLYISLCLALVVGTLTLTNGILHDARAATIAYRVAISIILFGVIGYALGVIGEKFYKELVAENNKQKLQNDVVNEQTDEEIVPEPQFSQFSSDNFEQISRPKE